MKASKRDLERQKIDLRSQIRKLEATIKEKDKRIEEITAEKERIEKRFKALSVLSYKCGIHFNLTQFEYEWGDDRERANSANASIN